MEISQILLENKYLRPCIGIIICILIFLLCKELIYWIFNGFLYFCVFYTLSNLWRNKKYYLKTWKIIKFWVYYIFIPNNLESTTKKKKKKHILLLDNKKL